MSVAVRARDAAKRAIRKGMLVRQPCVRCGEQTVHANHEDYSKPLDVTWLCRECHKLRHRESGDHNLWARIGSRSASRAPSTGEKRVVFGLSVPPGLLRQFDAVALRQNRSRAGMLMTIMQQAVESERS